MARFDGSIPPGGEGKITLTVNTKGYKGKTTFVADVHTNDPKNRFTMVAIGATVRKK
ncbi:MAG: hypothetical protein JW884_14000 [Deltaproteobacteria bacterium]|nr:hypothetical protein [Deltaproteobacteria bacterium]